MSFFGLMKRDIDKFKRKGSVDGLIRALGYRKDPEIRMEAAKALGELDNARAVRPLIGAMLEDSDPDVRHTAVMALGKIGVPAVEPLMGELWNTNQTNRNKQTAIVEALVKIGDPAIKPLIQTLWDPHKGKRLHMPVAEAIGKIGATAIRSLIVELPKFDRSGQEFAIEVLVTIGSPAIEQLIHALHDGDVNVRVAAAKALAATGDARAVDPLCWILKDPNKVVRKAAVEALDTLKWKPDSTWKGVWYWVTKGNIQKCLAADPSAFDILIAMFKAEEPSETFAARALGQTGDPRAVEPLIAALTHSLYYRKRAAAEALVALYQKGNLSSREKHQILGMREVMAKPHDDIDRPSDCTHADEGIGIEY
ncbi:MAG: HEAT repeat domain-containing protein [Methanospirillum sp.]